MWLKMEAFDGDPFKPFCTENIMQYLNTNLLISLWWQLLKILSHHIGIFGFKKYKKNQGVKFSI